MSGRWSAILSRLTCHTLGARESRSKSSATKDLKRLCTRRNRNSYVGHGWCDLKDLSGGSGCGAHLVAICSASAEMSTVIPSARRTFGCLRAVYQKFESHGPFRPKPPCSTELTIVFGFCPVVLTPLSGANEGDNRKMGHERLFLCGFLHWVAHLGPLGTLFAINIACIR